MREKSKKPRARRNEASPEEIAAFRAARDAKLAEKEELLQAGLADIRTSEDWTLYLKAAAQTHNYSFRNSVLIQLQRPGATLIAPRSRWVQMGFSILPDQTPIIVFAMPQGRSSQSRATKEKPLLDDDAPPSEDDQRVGAGRSRKGPPIPRETFDITQTTAASLIPRMAKPLTGDVTKTLFNAMVDDLYRRGWDFSLVHPSAVSGSLEGSANPITKQVIGRGDREPLDQLATTTHEHGHIEMDHVEDMSEYAAHRGLKETEAEAYCFLLASMADLDTSSYSLRYISGWIEQDPSARENVQRAVNNASHAVKRVLQRIPEIESDPLVRLENAARERYAEEALASNELYQAAQDPQLETPDDQASIAISHSLAQGTTVTGATYAHRELIKAFANNAFSFRKDLGDSGEVKGWQVLHSVGGPPNLATISSLATALRSAGATVAVTVQLEPAINPPALDISGYELEVEQDRLLKEQRLHAESADLDRLAELSEQLAANKSSLQLLGQTQQWTTLGPWDFRNFCQDKTTVWAKGHDGFGAVTELHRGAFTLTTTKGENVEVPYRDVIQLNVAGKVLDRHGKPVTEMKPTDAVEQQSVASKATEPNEDLLLF